MHKPADCPMNQYLHPDNRGKVPRCKGCIGNDPKTEALQQENEQAKRALVAVFVGPLYQQEFREKSLWEVVEETCKHHDDHHQAEEVLENEVASHKTERDEARQWSNRWHVAALRARRSAADYFAER